MHPVEITYFAITLFLALAGLIKWKYRKDEMAARLNRGLKGYVEGKGAAHCLATAKLPAADETGTEDLIVA